MYNFYDHGYNHNQKTTTTINTTSYSQTESLFIIDAFTEWRDFVHSSTVSAHNFVKQVKWMMMLQWQLTFSSRLRQLQHNHISLNLTCTSIKYCNHEKNIKTAHVAQ